MSGSSNSVSRWAKKVFGSSKKSNPDLKNQHPVQPISPGGTLASNNPFAGSEAAPPSYNEVMSGNPGASSSQDPGAAGTYRRVTFNGKVVTDEDNPYAFLSSFDTVFLIDDSTSMTTNDSGALYGDRWSEARDALAAIAPICVAHDNDGIDVHFINHPQSYRNITSAERVNEIFRQVVPMGTTNTGKRLDKILRPYMDQYKAGYLRNGRDPTKTGKKPMNLIVITDGAPTDDPEPVINDCIARLKKYKAPYYQIGIQFFQVGKDRKARAALADLDDNLCKDRDIVDTVTWDDGDNQARTLEGEKLLKVVLGSVVRRLDRQKADGRDPDANKK